MSGRADLAVATTERALDYDYKLWGFGEGPALLGVLRTGTRFGRPDLIDAVADLVAPTLERPPDPTDHLIPVEVLAALRRLRPALEVSGAAKRFAHAVLSAARPVPGRPAVHRLDLPGLSTLIWVDCMHTDGPGLALAGHEGSGVLAEACRALQDPASGLFSHGYDVATGRANDVHWGRGQGWALHGLAGVRGLPDPTARLLAGLETYELDGEWRTIVDDPAAPVENSVAALVASGILAGVRSGTVGAHWLPMAERALAAAVRALDSDAGLPVSAATPVGAAAGYLRRPIGVFPWGQGPLLLALDLDEERRAA